MVTHGVRLGSSGARDPHALGQPDCGKQRIHARAGDLQQPKAPSLAPVEPRGPTELREVGRSFWSSSSAWMTRSHVRS